MLKYTRIPTLSQWQSDSSVALTLRKSDPVLSRIDVLVSAIHEAPLSLTRVVACDLYFSVDYWLQYVKTNRGMERRREPAMRALYSAVVDFLCGAFNCTVNTLPRELDLMFGRELSMRGFEMDALWGRANYLKRKDIDKYKIWFRNGLAYQWAMPPARASRKLVNSSDVHNPDAFVNTANKRPNHNYGAFILTLDRNLYMARHMPGENQTFSGFYHSSYLGGQAVMAAGSMLIEAGRIKRMRSDSGHYKPVDTNMLQVLQTFKMLGVPIHDILVEDFDGGNVVKAPVFWVANADWAKLKVRANENQALRKHNFADRKMLTSKSDDSVVVLADAGYEA